MDCYEFESLLSDYCDGEMPPHSLKQFSKHRDDCPECYELLTDFKKAVNAIQSLPKTRTSDDFNQRLRERINQEVQVSFWERVQNFFSGSFLPRYVVATALLVGGLLIGAQYFGQDGLAPQPNSPAMNAPSLNIQSQQMSQPELPAAVSVDSQDTNRVKAPEDTPSFEGKIQYVNSD